jgi:hypothetical protein
MRKTAATVGVAALCFAGAATASPGTISADPAYGAATDALLSQATGFTVSCFQPQDWQPMAAPYGQDAGKVAGLTVTATADGVVVGGPWIRLPVEVCQNARQAAAQPSLATVDALRIVAHEAGNATMAANGWDNTNEVPAECYGEQHFWRLAAVIDQRYSRLQALLLAGWSRLIGVQPGCFNGPGFVGGGGR